MLEASSLFQQDPFCSKITDSTNGTQLYIISRPKEGKDPIGLTYATAVRRLCAFCRAHDLLQRGTLGHLLLCSYREAKAINVYIFTIYKN